MVDVGEVRVRVRHWLVEMGVAVRLARVGSGGMLVLMVLVVGVAVRVLQPLVRVLVPVLLGEVQPHARSHQPCREPEPARHRLAQEEQRGRSAHEGSQRKVSARARRSEASRGPEVLGRRASRTNDSPMPEPR